MRVMRSYLHGDTEWSQQKFIDIHIYMFNVSDSSDVHQHTLTTARTWGIKTPSLHLKQRIFQLKVKRSLKMQIGFSALKANYNIIKMHYEGIREF